MPSLHAGRASGGRRLPARWQWFSCGLAAVLVTPLQAQGTATGQPALLLQPRASVKETFSNNVRSSATDPLSDAVTEFSLGLGFRSQTGRLKGFLDYDLTGYRYLRNSDLNTRQNALRTNLSADVIENRFRVDVTAGITQSSISAFGVRPGSSGLPGDNVTEYRDFTITPLLSGPLGPAVQYKAGLTYSVSDARGTTAGDTAGDTAFITLSPSSPGVVGWSVDMSSQRSRFQAARETVDNRVLGTLNRKFESLDLLVNVSAGMEVTDLTTFERARYENYGIGATWAPSPRTRLQAQFDERFFGRAHSLTVEHRTALTTWTFTDARDLSTTGNGTTTTGRGPTFDLYYAQFAAVEPDPAKRIQLVEAYLKASGLLATGGTEAGFLRSGETIDRRQRAAVAYRGLRSSAVLTVGRNVTIPVEGAPLPGDDFTNTSNIVTEDVSLSLAHRLTPTSSANLVISYDRSHGDQPEQYSSQREVNLRYLAQLSVRSDLMVGARRTLYKTHLAPYDEGALYATYGIRF